MLKLFQTIALHGSSADKINLLKAYPYQSELKEVLRLALDPFITFGITGVTGEPKGVQDTFKVLERCARRELTGGEAKQTLGEACLDTEDQQLVTMILRKDLRCGLGPKTVERLYPGLLREFGVMRAVKYEMLPSRGSFVIEPKYDGLRCLAFIDDEAVTLYSRNGLEFTSSNHLKPQLHKLVGGKSCILDGELISGNFNQSSSSVRKKDVQDDSTSMYVFDLIDMDDWKNPVSQYRERRFHLEKLPFDQFEQLKLSPAIPVKTHDEVMKAYEGFLNMGLEGGMIKNTQGLYHKKKHRHWMKLKEVNDVDLRVESLVQGEGKYYGMLGAVIVKYGNKRVNVGGGFSDTERQMFWDNPELIKGKVIEIQYHQVTPDGSLRHPRFVKIREDKS